MFESIIFSSKSHHRKHRSSRKQCFSPQFKLPACGRSPHWFLRIPRFVVPRRNSLRADLGSWLLNRRIDRPPQLMIEPKSAQKINKIVVDNEASKPSAAWIPTNDSSSEESEMARPWTLSLCKPRFRFLLFASSLMKISNQCAWIIMHEKPKKYTKALMAPQNSAGERAAEDRPTEALGVAVLCFRGTCETSPTSLLKVSHFLRVSRRPRGFPALTRRSQRCYYYFGISQFEVPDRLLRSIERSRKPSDDKARLWGPLLEPLFELGNALSLSFYVPSLTSIWFPMFSGLHNLCIDGYFGLLTK